VLLDLLKFAGAVIVVAMCFGGLLVATGFA
jgi:hypothetical protein